MFLICQALTREDIARCDEFHIRGREATRDLAKIANIRKDAKVLDLGCGLGLIHFLSWIAHADIVLF